MSYIEKALLAGAKNEKIPEQLVLEKAKYEVILLNQKGRFQIRELVEGQNNKVSVWVAPLRAKRSSKSNEVGLIENLKGMGFALGGENAKAEAKKKSGQSTMSKFHENYVGLLSECDHPAIKAILSFLGKKGDPAPTAARILAQLAPDDTKAKVINDTKINTSSLVLFRYRNTYVHEIPEVVDFFMDRLNQKWDDKCPKQYADPSDLRCYITGKKIKQLLPPTKSPKTVGEYKLWTAKTDIKAYQHYGKNDTLNFPMERWTAYRVAAYVQRLLTHNPPDPNRPNKHLSTRYVNIGGDDQVCFWSTDSGTKKIEETTMQVTQDVVHSGLDTISLSEMKQSTAKIRKKDADNPQLVRRIYKSVWRVADKNSVKKKLDKEYCMATFGKSGKRGVLLDFCKTTFQDVQDNIAQHCADMHFETPRSIYSGKYFTPSLFQILKAAANPGQRSDVFSAYPQEVVRQAFLAIITGERYPAFLFQRAVNRSLHSVSDSGAEDVRTAFIKAYITRENRCGFSHYQEVGSMLNAENTNIGYLLGRYMSNVEYAQREAYGNRINAPVALKYGRAMATTPQLVFSMINQLFEAYVNKLYGSGKIMQAMAATRNINEVLDMFEADDIPSYMTEQDRVQYAFGRAHEKTYRIKNSKERRAKEGKAKKKKKSKK